MITDGQFEETYKGYIISSGIFLPEKGLYSVHVYESSEKKRSMDPAYVTNNLVDAKGWVDKQERAGHLQPWKAFLDRVSEPLELSPEYYYWQLEDRVTGEVFQRNVPFDTASGAASSARAFQAGRELETQSHLVVGRVFKGPFVGKAVVGRGVPVYEFVIIDEVIYEVGVTQLQRNALARLHPYDIVDYHSDGDLTVLSGGRLYVVTTEGGMFEEKNSGGLRAY